MDGLSYSIKHQINEIAVTNFEEISSWECAFFLYTTWSRNRRLIFLFFSVLMEDQRLWHLGSTLSMTPHLRLWTLGFPMDLSSSPAIEFFKNTSGFDIPPAPYFAASMILSGQTRLLMYRYRKDSWKRGGTLWEDIVNIYLHVPDRW